MSREPATITLSGIPVAFPVGGVPPGDRGWRGGAGRGGARGAGGRSPDRRPVRRARHIRPGDPGALMRPRLRATRRRRSSGPRPQLAVEHRDLYRRPLDADELAPFDARGARSAARGRRGAGRVRSPARRCAGSPMSAATPRRSRATPGCWSTAATRSTGCARSASSAGRPMSSSPPASAVVRG